MHIQVGSFCKCGGWSQLGSAGQSTQFCIVQSLSSVFLPTLPMLLSCTGTSAPLWAPAGMQGVGALARAGRPLLDLTSVRGGEWSLFAVTNTMHRSMPRRLGWVSVQRSWADLECGRGLGEGVAAPLWLALSKCRGQYAR